MAGVVRCTVRTTDYRVTAQMGSLTRVLRETDNLGIGGRHRGEEIGNTGGIRVLRCGGRRMESLKQSLDDFPRINDMTHCVNMILRYLKLTINNNSVGTGETTSIKINTDINCIPYNWETGVCFSIFLLLLAGSMHAVYR